MILGCQPCWRPHNEKQGRPAYIPGQFEQRLRYALSLLPSRDIDVEVANRSLGVTATERLLAGFCERSLLKLWTYPNPFKDDGKELCDVLAVFGNHVLVPDMSASSSPGPAPRRAPCLSSSPASSA
ncbi:hypothetical protein CEE62_01605 [Stenotrophomonas maltophilia]|nr:hypothetical protein [Stenotrophomonas maltophilia]OWQ82348.1 hypothetical protein CEE62_01605 [Stenotrophomonas maltophilia]